MSGRGTILVITAGTTDIPVAEEAVITAQLMGSRVETLFDAGVAGIHRLLSEKRSWIQPGSSSLWLHGGRSSSVVGGLVDQPVIAVPTSVGYGASFGGITALWRCSIPAPPEWLWSI